MAADEAAAAVVLAAAAVVPAAVAGVPAAAAGVPAAAAGVPAAAAVAAGAGRREWGPPLAPQRPERTNRGASLVTWGRGRSENVRK